MAVTNQAVIRLMEESKESAEAPFKALTYVLPPGFFQIAT